MLFWLGLLVFCLFVVCFFSSAVRRVVLLALSFLGTEIRELCYRTHGGLFQVENVGVRPVPIDSSLVNAPKNGWCFAGCPATVWVRRKIDNTTELEFGDFDERCMWYCWPGVDFYAGKKSGRIKLILVKHDYVRNRGQWFRKTCGPTEWPKYFTSVVLAHIEVFKFSQQVRSHNPTLISRICKQYGENFFQEAA